MNLPTVARSSCEVRARGVSVVINHESTPRHEGLKTFVFRNGTSYSFLRQAGPHRYLLVTQAAQREPANGYALHVVR
jgi:hypothetical protein